MFAVSHIIDEAHCKHSPFPSVRNSLGQTQSSSDVAPFVTVVRPSPQTLHSAIPVVDLYVPSSHFWQLPSSC